MSLIAGTKLGSYEILSALGAGGMGEVYRARDRKLDRDVAIKVLPEELAANPERIARFQREAKTLAALNHPGIAHIHGVEDSTGAPALVMELVEGPTLADRLKKGPLPLDEALAIAKQIAEALEAAHEQGIIHRDLKPANIKVREDGTVKILDFGLAKALEPLGSAAPGSSGPSNPLTQSPTLTTPVMMTGVGVILGTAAYMSPEQAKGKAADKRSDIWAFGCVLYEMLTGNRAFAGDDATDTLAAVLRSEPDIGRLPAETSLSIRRLLRRCLQKDPQRRLTHIGVARFEIDDAVNEPFSEPASPPTAQTTGASRALLLSTATAIIGAVVGGLVVFAALPKRAPVDLPVVRYSFAPPEGGKFGHSVFGRGAGPAAPQFAPSPDGLRLAYVMFTTGEPQLWVRRLDSISGQPLLGTQDASFPFWSSDGRFIGFFAEGKLKVIDASGGTPRIICDAPAGEGGTWNHDGQIVFAPEGRGVLFRVSSAGGVPSPVTQLDQSQHETSHRWPQFLPDGRHFMYLAIGGTAEGTYRASLDSNTRQLVLKNSIRASYAASGHLLFIRNGVLLAQPFDASSLRLSDDPKPIAESVPYNVGNGRAAYGISDTGVLAYQTDVDISEATSQIIWFDRTGQQLETIRTSGEIASLRLSPDEKQLAFSRRNRSSGVSDIWTLDLARGAVPSRVTTVPERLNRAPIWSPDGTHLIFAASDSGVADLFEQAASGVGDASPVLRSALPKIPTDWSRDGQFLAYYAADPRTKNDLWILPVSPPGKPKLFLQTPFTEGNARISPDGKWIAYESDEGGAFDIYVRSFPDGHLKWRISLDGGVSPEWRRDGKELFYLSGTRLMAVGIDGGSEFRASAPQRLFENPVFVSQHVSASLGRYVEGIAVGSAYAVGSNGRRFLTASIGPVKDVTAEAITVVVNWPVDLRK